jgi:hypothetical protein
MKRFVKLLCGFFLLIGSIVVLGKNVVSSADEDFKFVLHYKRSDNNYDGWGLHIWNDSHLPVSNTSWEAPRGQDGIDAYGIYWEFNDVSFTTSEFVLHRGDDKFTGNNIVIQRDNHVVNGVYNLFFKQNSSTTNIYYGDTSEIRTFRFNYRRDPSSLDGNRKIHWWTELYSGDLQLESSLYGYTGLLTYFYFPSLDSTLGFRITVNDNFNSSNEYNVDRFVVNGILQKNGEVYLDGASANVKYTDVVDLYAGLKLSLAGVEPIIEQTGIRFRVTFEGTVENNYKEIIVGKAITGRNIIEDRLSGVTDSNHIYQEATNYVYNAGVLSFNAVIHSIPSFAYSTDISVALSQVGADGNTYYSQIRTESFISIARLTYENAYSSLTPSEITFFESILD